MPESFSKTAAKECPPAQAPCCDSPGSETNGKSKLEKTQSLLSVLSTSIGLLGVAGSVFAYGLSSFYTGTVKVTPDRPGIVVKVYTQEGHQSVFHTRQINLMPGKYHLEISSPEGKVVNTDASVDFHKTTIVPVDFFSINSTERGREPTRRRWWQLWKRNSDSTVSSGEER